MAASRDRARSLGRIAFVQTEMVRLAEWKLAAARRRRRVLDEESDLLTVFSSGDALSADLAKAVLRTSKTLVSRELETDREIAADQARLDTLRRRGHVLNTLEAEAKRAMRREEEAAALVETIEAWFARKGTSLP